SGSNIRGAPPMVRMLATSLSLAAALVFADVVTSVPADARVNVNINIGTGTSLNFGRNITCAQGARLIRNRGFSNVTQRNCGGRTFTYDAWRRGRQYRVSVRARDGVIVDYFRVGGGRR